MFSSASQLIGLEISEEFVKLQKDIVEKYQLTDRIKVQRHTHILTGHVHTGGGLVTSLLSAGSPHGCVFAASSSSQH